MARGKGRPQTYPEESNTDKTKALRRLVKELEAENKRLKSELKTLNMAFAKTAGYIKGNLDSFSIDKVVAAVRQEKTMVEIQSDVCPDCGAEVKETKLPHATMRLCSAACGYREVK